MNALVKLTSRADLLSMHALRPGRYPILLESSGGMPGLAEFDILMAFPESSLTLHADWTLSGGPPELQAPDFLGRFDEWWGREVLSAVDGAGLPFQGGWFVFLGYELARQIEPSIELTAEADSTVAHAVRIPAAIIRVRRTGRCYAIAEPGREALLRQIVADIRQHARGLGPDRGGGLVVAGTVREEDPGHFLRSVGAVQRYIRAGDIYQANISRRWSATVPKGVEPWMIYDRLRRANPAPFSGLALVGDVAIVCSSPERLLRVRRGWAETRPIAGTRPRHNPTDPELVRVSELVTNPKERAEHVMLIDLERNDLGRVCTPGTVKVTEFMAVESYAHVHHIVSNVRGQLRPGTRPGSVLRAVFPGGTITGCPKVRCMSVIQELESRPRGAYTGAMGYINRDGSSDLNILIRTMSLKGDALSVSAGSGVVSDSIPERELDETRAKAKGMLLALQG